MSRGSEREAFVQLSFVGVVIVGACGGSTSSDVGSGVSGEKPLSDLDSAEVSQLCEFMLDVLGGEGAEYECSGITITVGTTSECIDSASDCDALVADAEACSRGLARALRRCELDATPSSCDRLEGCTTTTSGSGGGCIDGRSQSCTCDDGRAGAQTCVGGRYTPCGCGPTGSPDRCVPGAARICACPDGSTGAQMCLAQGSPADYGPCLCGAIDPPGRCVVGSTIGCVCADGSSGTQTCAAAGDSVAFGPCVCAPISGACIPGQAAQCACADGSRGVQTCVGSGASAYFSPCQCASQGTCDPGFCPRSDVGAPCCVTTNGPCGTDSGTGCIAGL